MDTMLAVGRLAFGSVEFVGGPRYLAVRGSLVRLPGPPATQRRVRLIEPAPHLGETLVSSFVETAGGLCPPELVLLGDQLFDLVEDGLLFHSPSIVGMRPGALPPGPETLGSQAVGRALGVVRLSPRRASAA